MSKKTAFQMAIKAFNNTISLEGLMPILLIFVAYPYMHSINLSASTIIQKLAIIKKAIEQIRKIWAKNQVIDALNTINKLFINFTYNFLLHSNMAV